MSQYKECPWCGCNLDPGEQCDCEGATEWRKSNTHVDNEFNADLIDNLIIASAPGPRVVKPYKCDRCGSTDANRIVLKGSIVDIEAHLCWECERDLILNSWPAFINEMRN